MMKKLLLTNCEFFAVCLAFCCMVSCSKVEYRTVAEPAYLRVFNNLDYEIRLGNKDEPQPFLTMLIDPVFDANGVPVDAAVIGDFMDLRRPYAASYPGYTGNTSNRNYDFPGNTDVVAAPVLNGFDLSGWAQVPSGTHQVQFYSRPISEVPFFDLEPRLRQVLMVDSTIDLQEREVYTMHVLQKDFVTKENGIYLRQENFYKQSFSDSLVYINFYNLSAKGFVEADDDLKPIGGEGIRDRMDVYYTLYNIDGWDPAGEIPGYTLRYLTTMVRENNDSRVNPYVSFPLFADSKSDGISTNIWERFTIINPAMDPAQIDHTQNPGTEYDGNYAAVVCYRDGTTVPPKVSAGSYQLPNLIVSTHSGTYNPRSFATVNSLEVVNGRVYLTSIQRRFPPPIY